MQGQENEYMNIDVSVSAIQISSIQKNFFEKGTNGTAIFLVKFLKNQENPESPKREKYNNRSEI